MIQGRTCVIMQPTYLPWLGYFDLIDQSDVFVFLDTVQFEKRSWQQRNRILIGEGLGWLTVPVRVSGRRSQLIREVEILRSPEFPRRHIALLEQHYRRAPHFERYFGPLREILADCPPQLSVLNQRLIAWLAGALGLKASFRVASSLEATGERTGRLRNICRELGAQRYLSPLGSAAYLLEEHGALTADGIRLSFQRYEHPSYRQPATLFQPYASAVDLLFNEGDRSLGVIRQGRRCSYSLEEVRSLETAASGGIHG